MDKDKPTIPVHVNLDVAAIDSALLRIITKSAIGVEIQNAIEKMLSEKGDYRYRDAVEACVEKVVKEYVKQAVLKTLTSEPFESQIKQLIQDKVTTAFATDLFSKAWDKFIKEVY